MRLIEQRLQGRPDEPAVFDWTGLRGPDTGQNKSNFVHRVDHQENGDRRSGASFLETITHRRGLARSG